VLAGAVDATPVDVALVDGALVDGALDGALLALLTAAVVCTADAVCAVDAVFATGVLLLHAASSKPVAKHAANAATVCRRRFIMAGISD
jgi:hypothetical protein